MIIRIVIAMKRWTKRRCEIGRTVCKAKATGQSDRRGHPNIEWYKDVKPQYYCYGIIDCMTDELLEVCRNCPDHVDKAQDDYDKWRNGKAV